MCSGRYILTVITVTYRPHRYGRLSAAPFNGRSLVFQLVSKRISQRRHLTRGYGMYGPRLWMVHEQVWKVRELRQRRDRRDGRLRDLQIEEYYQISEKKRVPEMRRGEGRMRDLQEEGRL